MTQLQMFDPRSEPTATEEMLADRGLRDAIARMRRQVGLIDRREDWPYVERLVEIDGRPAWLVDDHLIRYVVVNGFIWQPDELGFAAPKMREAAKAAMARA